jgi:8-oxo-dGTP pyrophosphatase MutT (NUDIX family)
VERERPAHAPPTSTWDGLPVAADEPHGSAIVVRRSDGRAGHEYLLLHRAHRGRDYAGDWAWTPPSGARLPGEPVLSAALRELAEETGITAAEPVPVDLSRPWAIFLAEVPRGTAVRLDAEHDRFSWASAERALARCRPPDVAANVAAAAAVRRHKVAFRPLARTDLPDLIGWQRAPHAARWFPERLDLAAAERKYGPRIDGHSPVRVDVVLVVGAPIGFVQHYPLPEPESAGLDFCVGNAELTGIGLGPQLIWAYLRAIVLPARPRLRTVVASPEAANSRSIRVLTKAGFRPAGEPVRGQLRGRPELRCVLDRGHMLGQAG